MTRKNYTRSFWLFQRFLLIFPASCAGSFLNRISIKRHFTGVKLHRKYDVFMRSHRFTVRLNWRYVMQKPCKSSLFMSILRASLIRSFSASLARAERDLWARPNIYTSIFERKKTARYRAVNQAASSILLIARNSSVTICYFIRSGENSQNRKSRENPCPLPPPRPFALIMQTIAPAFILCPAVSYPLPFPPSAIRAECFNILKKFRRCEK